MRDESPFVHYNNKLGVKIKFLTSDRKPHANSLQLISYRALKKRMDSSSCTEKQLRNGSWGGGALILYSSLCRDWKDALTTTFGNPKEEIKRSWFADHYIADRSAFDFYVAHRYGKNNEHKLDIEKVEEYTYNASVLNTVIQMKNNRKEYARALGFNKLDIWQSLSNDVNAFREVAHTLPASKDGLRRKATTYAKALEASKKAAYKSLISGKLQNSNAKKVTEKEQMALLDELISKHTNLDNELISTIYNTVAEKMNWKTITAMTVSNRKNKKKVISHAGRSGVKSLKNNVLMQNKRSKPDTPMLYWTLDGWDVELLYQKTTNNDKGHNVTTYHNRLTVVVVLDTFNNYPIGFAIGSHETPELIKEACQNAMQHARELFGDFYMPYQLQSDNYSIKALRPIYEALTRTFTPASAGNAKAKVIEPYFNHLNKKYCKLLNNWSGHNVNSGSKNQPNSEYLDKIKKQFPDQFGCVKQIESIISAERSKKAKDYGNNWLNTKEEHKTLMNQESYLLTFGTSTGYTNKLKGEGLGITIQGEKHWYDSFDINFRHHADKDWAIQYDINDLSKVLAVSKDGKERFILEQKYVQPMALANRKDGDAEQLQRVSNFNKKVVEMIVDERAQNARLLEPFLDQPELNDTLAKHLLTDSIGQHKNHKSKARLKVSENASKIALKQSKQQANKKDKSFMDEQLEYYSDKVNINEYLDD
ncbi:hypothetical protein [Corallibacter sp.]|uniref:hypothetical protein n=1 Tax=Corallibacter sp. TaxID=2038084 RepID=UPI003A9219D3